MVGAIHQGYGQIRNIGGNNKIYGIKRLLLSEDPKWERTDNAVGLTATASIGTETIGYSDFNKVMPWKGMVRKTLSTGDTMVYIPKFWYQRWQADGYEYIRVSPNKAKNFFLHPGSNRYISAYRASKSAGVSVKGVDPWYGNANTRTLAQIRKQATSKGTGWYCMDIAILSAIRMLFLVEFATNNAQNAIGTGFIDYGGDQARNYKTGTCDDVPNLTGRPSGTDGRVDIVYRGIETPWGTGCCFTDGLIVQNAKYYVTTDPAEFSSDDLTQYHTISYAQAVGYPYRNIQTMGCDNSYPWLIMPASVVADGKDYTKFYCGYSYTLSRNVIAHLKYGNVGLFCTFIDDTYVDIYTPETWRLMYIPE